MNLFKGKRVLIISPHPDDEVFGCGGLINRCKREGGEVYVLYLTVGSTNDFSKNAKSSKDVRIKEVEDVAKFFKLDGYKIVFPGDDYHLQLDSIPIKKIIHEVESGEDISLEAIKPFIVVMPSVNDYNQDHRIVNQAVVAATRPVNPDYKHLQNIVLEYELPPNTWSDRSLQFAPNFYLELEKEDLEAKMKVISLYKSQIKDDEGLFSPYGVKIQALMRGIQTGKKQAEAFYARRILYSNGFII